VCATHPEGHSVSGHYLGSPIPIFPQLCRYVLRVRDIGTERQFIPPGATLDIHEGFLCTSYNMKWQNMRHTALSTFYRESH
jgi:hypothetical protein